MSRGVRPSILTILLDCRPSVVSHKLQGTRSCMSFVVKGKMYRLWWFRQLRMCRHSKELYQNNKNSIVWGNYNQFSFYNNKSICKNIWSWVLIRLWLIKMQQLILAWFPWAKDMMKVLKSKLNYRRRAMKLSLSMIIEI